MITIIVPYYNQPLMLKRQIEEFAKYPSGYNVTIVDDCSLEPAENYIPEESNISLYRIDVDVPWNRGQARNIGAFSATTEWIIQIDTDHVLPAECAEWLLQVNLDSRKWYRFNRYRVGRADETRHKDKLSEDCEYGKIHPHIDSYLMPTKMFLSSPYDERYSGCLGGGSPFLQRMQNIHGAPEMLPDDVWLEVHTRHSIPDASIDCLNRETAEYKRRRAQIGGSEPKTLIQPWHKVL